MDVDIGNYFKQKCYDDKLLDFIRYDVKTPKRIKYILQKSMAMDEESVRLQRFYQLGLDLKLKHFKRKSLKKQGRIKNASEELLRLANEQLKLFNRIVERETNWIIYPLWVMAKQLICLANESNELNRDSIEECGRTIHRSFTICLNDRNPRLNENKKIGCYMFANLEFAIYHRLKNKDMIKNLVKVLESRVNARDIPPLNQSLAIEHKSQIVLYNYYLGQYYGCLENDHERGFFHLNEALLQCPLLYVESTGKFVLQHQMEKIMALVVPLGLLTKRLYPRWDHPVIKGIIVGSKRLGQVYPTLVRSVITGNLPLFDATMAKHERFFLNQGLHVTMALLREVVFVRLVQRCWQWGNDQKSVMPLHILLAMTFQSDPADESEEEQLNSLECRLASAISNGLVRAYLSHSNRCIVFSKKEPFPHGN
ncbi:COP9 signalosome (CSN) subunit [Saccharomyces pastorianus]|uniref:COP9 signalosome (CSN) subunit n=1 Tax=Saccharomyces pastorianus TaxID=27292 RepID=A0A6C1DU21_SACPS|nr:COP9 signalosome (CSN) subunit [Saccharomyces pastorianus]